MNDLDRDLVFSQAVKAGKRIYYFDVKQSKNGDRYISITESKKVVEGSFENPHITFEKHKLFLYKEDYEKFLNALVTTLEVAKTGEVPIVEEKSVEKIYAESNEADTDKTEASSDVVVEETTIVSEETKEVDDKSIDDSFKIDLDF